MSVTFKDVFCGALGSSLGAIAAGGELKLGVNHWRRAIDTGEKNHPDADFDCADVSALTTERIRRYPNTDVLLASPECFTAGVLILTTRGLVPIEQIVVGDRVLTHRLRWRRVSATMSRISDTVVVRGEGHHGLETTAEHPFYARGRTDYWDNSIRQGRWKLESPDWVPASRLKHSYWCSPTCFGDPLPVPPVPGRALPFTEEFWWMVGRWLGDGLLRIREQRASGPRRPKNKPRRYPAPCLAGCGALARPNRRYPHLAIDYCSQRCRRRVENQRPGRGQGSEVHITCGPHEVIELAAKLDYAPPAGVRAKEGELRWRRRDVRTGAYFATAHTGLALWLRDHFGSGAAGKKMPAWALSMPEDWRRSLLDGYTSADGHDNGRRMMVSTVSRSLAVGVRLLALSLGHKAGLHSPSSRTSGTIEGRVVRMRPLTHVGWTTNPDPKHERTREADGLRWSQVKSVFLSRSAVRVFNLSVEEDESYLADGIVVHNCTNHSIAKGARRRKPQAASLFDDGPAGSDEQDRSRATMWDVCRFAEMKALQGHAYKAIIVENVVDARRWGYGDNGGLFDAWLLAMQSLGYEHEIVYLNSMFCPPVPQSRDRMYVVFWLRSMRRPNLKVEPPCWCPNCEKVVSGRQTWKKPGKIWGRYASQYFYSCCECYRPAIPGGMPAASIIDPTLPAPVIGEREKPLAKNTRERIRRGLERLATEPFAIRLTHGTTPKPLTLPLVTATARQDLSMVLPVAGNTYESTPGNRAKDAARDPLQTVHGTLERALVLRTGHKSANGRLANAATTEQTHALTTQQDAAMVLANTENNVPRPASREAAQTLRTQGSLALTFSNRMNNVPRPAGEAPAHPVLTGGHLGVVEVQRNGGVKRAGDAPAHTVRANGRHHAVVLANYSPGWAKDADRHPTGSLTAVDGHALAFPYSTKGEPKRAGAEPADTITTRNKAALVVPYYTRGSAAIASREPNATVSTRDRLSLVVPSTLDPEAPETLDTAPITEADIDGCRFRMFSLQEISRAMAMELHANGEPYVVVGNKRERMAQYGNAVTPPVMALLFARVLEILDEPSAPRKAA